MDADGLDGSRSQPSKRGAVFFGVVVRRVGTLLFLLVGWCKQDRHSLLCSVAAVSFGLVWETDCCFLDAKRSSKTP